MANGFTGRLRAFLGLDTSEFDRNLRRSGQNVRGFGQDVQSSLTGAIASASGFGKTFAGALAGGVVATAFAGVTTNMRETIRGIAAIGDEAKRAGVPLQAFQEWSFVADQNRIEVDSLIDGFKELSLRADEFVVTGAGPASEAFGRLGYTASDLRRKLKDPSELLMEVLERMEDLDTAAQIRVSDEIFGGSAGERFVELLGQGEGKVRDTIRQFRELGIAFDKEAIDKAVELDQAFGRVSLTIGNLYQKVVVGFADTLANTPVISFGETEVHIEDLLRLLVQVEDKLADIGSGGETDALAEAYAKLSEEASSAAVELAAAASQADLLGYDDLWAVLADGSNELRELADQFARGDIDGDTFARRLEDIQQEALTATTAIEGIDEVQFGGLMGSLGRLGSVLQTIATLGRAAAAAVPGANGPTDPPAPEGWQNPDIVLPPRAMSAPRRPGVDTYGDWLAAREEANKPKGGGKKAEVDDYTAATKAIREEIAALEAEAAAFLAVEQSSRDYGDAVEYARRRAELMYAAQKAGKEVTPELQAEIDKLAQSYVTVGMNAEEAADRLERIEENGRRGADALSDIFLGVLNGSKSAKDAVASLLVEMAKIQMQKAMLGLASGGGILGTVGGLLTLPGNAGGTQNWRGGLTRINELGGEIMNLPRGTQIIPHDISRRMADGATDRSANIGVTVGVDPETGNLMAFVDRRATAIATANGREVLRQVPSVMNNHDKRKR